MAESSNFITAISDIDFVYSQYTLIANTWNKDIPLSGFVLSDSEVQDFVVDENTTSIFTLKPVEFSDLPESIGDLQILPNIDNLGDFDLSSGDIATDKGLRTSVYLSLFTDSFCEEDGYTVTNGWWGDSFNDVGSKLWTLKRKRITDSVLVLAKTYVEESLQWMIDDGVADKIEVDTNRTGLHSIQIDISIYKPSTAPEIYQFDFNWNAEENR